MASLRFKSRHTFIQQNTASDQYAEAVEKGEIKIKLIIDIIPGFPQKVERSIFVTLIFENIAHFGFYQINHCLLKRMIPRSFDLVL